MNDEQEMQFADPAWQPKVTREFEAASPAPPPTGASEPRSSGGAASAFQTGEAEYNDYAHGYRPRDEQASGRDYFSQNQAPPPFQGQHQQSFQDQPPQQPLSQMMQDLFKRLPVWAWWVIGIVAVSIIVQPASSRGGLVGELFSLIFAGLVVFVGWLLYTRRMRISLSGETQAGETRTFIVGAQPTIILKNKAGSINLRSGEEGQVSITTARRGFLFSPSLDKETQIIYSQDSAANTVTVRTESWRLFGKNAITFDVVVPPQANLQLSTNFGQISVSNVAGQMTLHSDAGTIQATDVALQGKSRLKGDAGTIVFSGSLDPTGSYELITDLGTIDAILPADASFELSAKTDLGSISTNFPLAQSQRTSARGNVGSGPYPKLKIKTDIGTINIQRQ